MKFFQLIIAIILLISFTTNADVYKWVDENGMTHYGNQKPAKPDVTQVDINDVKETGSANHGKLQNVSTEEQDAINGIAKAFLKDRGNADELNCSLAVSSALDQINTYTAQAKHNLENGYITQANYAQVESMFSNIKPKLSTSACQASSGAEKEMYLCLSNDMNAAVMCFGKAESLFN